MPTTIERVDRLERVFSSFMERSEEALLDIRASVAEIKASNARTDAQLLEMQRQAERRHEEAVRHREQAERERRDFNKRMAEISDSMGKLVEDMVWPNAQRIFSEIFPDDAPITAGLRVSRRHPRDRGRSIEFDLLVTGAAHVLVVESKLRQYADKVRDFQERLDEFPEFFPEYAGLHMAPAVASVCIEPHVVRFLNGQKIYAIVMGDETMEVINAGAF